MTVARLALTWVVTWPALVSCDSGTGRKSLAGRTRAQPSPCALSFHTPESGGGHPPILRTVVETKSIADGPASHSLCVVESASRQVPPTQAVSSKPLSLTYVSVARWLWI